MKFVSENIKQRLKLMSARANLALAAVLVGCCACAYDPQPTSEANQTPQTSAVAAPSPSPIPIQKLDPSPVLKSVTVSADFVGSIKMGPQPNQYSVTMNWRAAPETEAFAIRRKDASGNILQLDLITPTDSQYEDTRVQPGTRYSYQLMSLNGGALKDAGSFEISVPKDFEVIGINFTNKIGPDYNRLFIRKNSALVANAQDLSIEVNELISEGSINSFTTPAPSLFNQAGLSGGFIHIHAKRAHGTLNLFAFGQDGSSGFPGSPGTQGAKGDHGIDAEDDYESICTASESIFSKVNLRSEGGRCFRSWHCSRDTGDGGPGQAGSPGFPGTDGQAGGNTPRVLIEIDEPNDIDIKPLVQPGQGGRGGLGGPGGPGGVGGDPGARDSRELCRVANSGPQGPNGPAGANGSNGADGHVSPICIKLGAANSGDCQSFTEMTR